MEIKVAAATRKSKSLEEEKSLPVLQYNEDEVSYDRLQLDPFSCKAKCY